MEDCNEMGSNEKIKEIANSCGRISITIKVNNKT